MDTPTLGNVPLQDDFSADGGKAKYVAILAARVDVAGGSVAERATEDCPHVLVESGKCLIDIGEYIVDMFDADGETDHFWRDATGDLGFRAEL